MAYTIDGLENGIKECRKHIVALETAIDNERNTIKEYRIMIDDLEFSKKQKEDAAKNVHLEIVDGSKE